MSQLDKTNPKDLLGIKKVPLGEVPAVAIAHESCAMLDGDLKYGFRNWRENDVQARVYTDAARRHISAWEEGEDYAEDSGVHHLAHARACLGILLDAQESGLPKRSVVVVSQIFTVDKSQLDEHIGTLGQRRVRQILEGIRLVTEPREAM